MPNIHPMLVHFPIALIIVVFIIDMLGLILKNKKLVETGTILTLAAFFGAAAAVISGIIVEDSVWLPGAAHELLGNHELMGFIVLGVIAVMAIVRFALRDKLEGAIAWLLLALGAISIAIIAYGAYLGGEMVYAYGTGVKVAEDCTREKAHLEGKLKAVERTDKAPIQNLDDIE